ncbi:DHH family phosphoesterase [Candidatus Bathyarchaeota archaeon]|nr:DHH family phosphoesterase [Candidatus Bathyarchaeota archaeon]MBS7627651.1 DHH family phosphoesterase [Candidatus Bathyarchaeota archaeon]
MEALGIQVKERNREEGATIVITHGDGDGICSGALLKRLFPDCLVRFSRPKDLKGELRRLEGVQNLFLCDLAINEGDEQAIIEGISRIASSGTKVFFIDHHPLPPNLRVEGILGATVFHDVEASTSELVYKAFKDRLDPEGVFLALYGAIADYADNTPFVTSELTRWDKRIIYMEAAILVEALTQIRDPEYKLIILEELAQGKKPSEVPNLSFTALEGLRKEYQVYEYVRKYVTVKGDLAIVSQLPFPGYSGKAATYAAAITGAKVGLVVNLRNDRADLSLRTRSLFIDLNDLLRKITRSLGGHGGGHHQAASAQIPSESLEGFLDLLNAFIKK